EKKPEDRPQSVMELAHELNSAVKAITEQELQKVFLDATEDDLEAALLLASEPGSGMLSDTGNRRRGTGGLDTSMKKSPVLDTVLLSDSQQIPAGGGGEGVDNLLVEMLQNVNDLSMMLQVVREDLEKSVPPDPLSFIDLKTLVDKMRGLLFGLQTTYYK